MCIRDREPSQGKGGIVRMRYYNADGGEAEMCGNGARCFGHFAAALLHHDKTAPLPFETMAGVVTATFEKDDNVTCLLYTSTAPGLLRWHSAKFLT